jgi:C4-dicarboxylate-specific signal transduction histidine kinase
VSGAPDCDREVLIAANRATVYGTIGRWLMHDVRSPAQAISLVGDLLDQPDTPPDSTLRDTLHAASARLNQCLQLLDHALRAAPGPAEPGPVALAAVIEQIAALHAGNHAGVRLDTAQAPLRSLPAVRGSEDRLAHALLNLVVNAHEAIVQRGRGTIRLSGRVAEDGRTVALVVEDDGPGTPAEMRDRLFEPFVTTKTGRPLAGLGLTVARWLVEDCAGSVRHEPAAHGARFVVDLATWRPSAA